MALANEEWKSRALIIRGIKETTPQNQNISKAFGEQQEKEETPIEWLERLRKNMKQYSGIDTENSQSTAIKGPLYRTCLARYPEKVRKT